MPEATDSTSRVLLKKELLFFRNGACVYEQTDSAGSLDTTSSDYTRFQKHAATTAFQCHSTFANEAGDVMSELKTERRGKQVACLA